MNQRRLSATEKQQKEQLEYIQSVLSSLPRVNGVPICEAFVYDIMALTNQAAKEKGEK